MLPDRKGDIMPEKKFIAIVDYGMENLRSLEKAFEKVGYNAIVTSDPKVILNADGIVLPSSTPQSCSVNQPFPAAFQEFITPPIIKSLADLMLPTDVRYRPFFFKPLHYYRHFFFRCPSPLFHPFTSSF